MSSTLAEPRSFTITRRYKATPQRMYQAWTDPQLMLKWFIPGDQVSIKNLVLDPRKDGEFTVDFWHKEEQQQYLMNGRFQKLIPYSLIQLSWGFEGDTHPRTTVSVEIRETDNGCELTLTHAGFVDAEKAASHAEGWTNSTAVLQNFVAEDKERFHLHLTRVIKAPIERVYNAWADPDIAIQWMKVEKGWKPGTFENDVRVGGELRETYVNTESSEEVIIKGYFLEVDPPHRISSVSCCTPGDMVYVAADFRSVGDSSTEVSIYFEMDVTEYSESAMAGNTSIVDSFVEFFQ